MTLINLSLSKTKMQNITYSNQKENLDENNIFTMFVPYYT